MATLMSWLHGLRRYEMILIAIKSEGNEMLVRNSIGSLSTLPRCTLRAPVLRTDTVSPLAYSTFNYAETISMSRKNKIAPVVAPATISENNIIQDFTKISDDIILESEVRTAIEKQFSQFVGVPSMTEVLNNLIQAQVTMTKEIRDNAEALRLESESIRLQNLATCDVDDITQYVVPQSKIVADKALGISLSIKTVQNIKAINFYMDHHDRFMANPAKLITHLLRREVNEFVQTHNRNNAVQDHMPYFLDNDNETSFHAMGKFAPRKIGSVAASTETTIVHNVRGLADTVTSQIAAMTVNERELFFQSFNSGLNARGTVDVPVELPPKVASA